MSKKRSIYRFAKRQDIVDPVTQHVSSLEVFILESEPGSINIYLADNLKREGSASITLTAEEASQLINTLTVKLQL